MVTAFVCDPVLALILASLKEQTGSNKNLLGADPTSPTTRFVGVLQLGPPGHSRHDTCRIWFPYVSP